MALFSAEDFATLVSQFPDKPVRDIMDQVERKAASGQTVGSPMGLASSWLRGAKSSTTVREKAPAISSRGTFREDGSWFKEASAQSRWESDLYVAAKDIRVGFMSPAAASALLLSRGLSSMIRESSQAIWARLDSFDHWPCAVTSTSAEQWLKMFVVGE